MLNFNTKFRHLFIEQWSWSSNCTGCQCYRSGAYSWVVYICVSAVQCGVGCRFLLCWYMYDCRIFFIACSSNRVLVIVSC